VMNRCVKRQHPGFPVLGKRQELLLRRKAVAANLVWG
jgi:hypothetical protein